MRSITISEKTQQHKDYEELALVEDRDEFFYRWLKVILKKLEIRSKKK